MTKFLFMTDTHARTNNPVSRKDDFSETILKKIGWCINYANEIGAFILHGGDWVNRPDTSPAYVSKMCKILGDASLPIYGIIGNHDIYGYNKETFYRTPLHIANVCGAFSIIDEETSLKMGNVYISGAHSSGLIDKNGRTAEYYTPRRLVPKVHDEIRIHVVHGFLTDHDWPDGVPYTKIDDVLDTDADILLTGHEHCGYGILYKNDTCFCNPGALGRVSAAVGDVNRNVQVAVIEVDDDGKFTINMVPLPDDIARPSDEVLDRDRLEEEKAAAAKIETFAAQIEQIQIDEEAVISIDDTMEQMHRILDGDTFDGIPITDNMRKLIFDYIGQAEKLEQESREKLKSND